MNQIDLNCDMGESFGVYSIGDDAKLMETVSSANIACGFHGGDPLVMDRTMRLALSHGVGIGAHPSFHDLWGFGRRAILGEAPEDIGKAVIYQIAAAQGMARSAGHRLRHVKLHGALANMAFGQSELAAAVAQAIAALDADLLLVAMPGSELERAGEMHGLHVVREIYADRAYGDDGNLLPRREAGAVLSDPEMMAERVLEFIRSSTIATVSGKRLPAGRIDSVAVHADTAGAADVAAALRLRLEQAGFTISPMASLVSAGNAS